MLQHFDALLQDAHVRVEFTRPAPPVAWPGLLARFDGSRYRVAVSRDCSIAVGAPTETCDGQPVAYRVNTIAPLEIGLPESLESTR